MTNHDTELAREIFSPTIGWIVTTEYIEFIQKNITQALRSVRQAENEECANVAADHTIATGQYIASAIRNRMKDKKLTPHQDKEGRG